MGILSTVVWQPTGGRSVLNFLTMLARSASLHGIVSFTSVPLDRSLPSSSLVPSGRNLMVVPVVSTMASLATLMTSFSPRLNLPRLVGSLRLGVLLISV